MCYLLSGVRRWSLSVVGCVSCVDCCSLLAVRCALFVVRCSLFVVCCLMCGGW